MIFVVQEKNYHEEQICSVVGKTGGRCLSNGSPRGSVRENLFRKQIVKIQDHGEVVAK